MKSSPEQVAHYTLTGLKRRVPPAVPGIMFLSGAPPARARARPAPCAPCPRLSLAPHA